LVRVRHADIPVVRCRGIQRLIRVLVSSVTGHQAQIRRGRIVAGFSARSTDTIEAVGVGDLSAIVLKLCLKNAVPLLN
jgi:hypothetical protein